jgi:cold shock protein
MKIGTVRWFNLQKGHGYISPDGGGPNIFVARSAVEGAGLKDLKEGQKVAFDVRHDDRLGRTFAASLSPIFVHVQPLCVERSAPTHPFDALSQAVASAWRARLGAPRITR